MTPAAKALYTQTLAGVIDHTLLKPEATTVDIDRLIAEAIRYSFASVCINPGWVERCRKALAGSKVKTCTVVGFPLGATSTASKAFEAAQSLASGAQEIDMVLNIGALRSGMSTFVQEDIAAVAAETRNAKGLLKVILETALLSDDEKRLACTLAVDAGADFVKTSTGFAPGGATVADVRLLREAVGLQVGVKASGGIRTLAAAQAMLNAGATRLGLSAGVQILNEVDGAATTSGTGTY